MKKSLLALCAVAITGFATFSAFTDAESDEAKIAKELDAKITAFKAAESAKCRETALEAARSSASEKLAVLQAEYEALAKKKGIKVPSKPKTPTVKPAPTPVPNKQPESPKLDIKGGQGEGKLDVKATTDGKTQGSGKLKIK